MKPLVSVVIPCYNAEKFVKECIRSVQIQDYPNVEIIVVNDASKDRSVDVVYKLIADDSRIMLINNPSNRGECYASVIGFKVAKGAYICRLSSDDAFISPSHISKQVHEMEKYDLDWCYNNVNLVGSTISTAKEVQSKWLINPVLDNWFLNHSYICYLIAGKRNPVNSSALMFRASSYKNILTWDGSGLRSRCDGAILAKMLLLGLKGKAIHSIGVFYRIHPGQTTGTPDADADMRRLREQIYSETTNPKYPIWLRIVSYILWRTL